MDGRPGMFWIVQAGALATVPVLFYIFRNETREVDRATITPITNMFPTYTLLATVACLVAASFIPEKPAITNGLICMFFCMNELVSVLENISLLGVPIPNFLTDKLIQTKDLSTKEDKK